MSSALNTAPNEESVERRQSQRRPMRGLAEVTFAGHPPHPVRMLDISVAGMGIVAAINPVPRTPCLVRFALPTKPNQTQFMLKAVVIHSVFSAREGNFRIGLLFASMPAEVANAIQTFIASVQSTQVDRVS